MIAEATGGVNRRLRGGCQLFTATLHEGLSRSSELKRNKVQGGMVGRGERIRTSGLYVPNVALYQAKLHPDFFAARRSSLAALRRSFRSLCPRKSGRPTERRI